MADDATIKLDQFLKRVGAVQSGGEAKQHILNGLVSVNGEPETRRGRKLKQGDQVSLGSHTWSVSDLRA
jgi:ribosome-associated protein